MMRIIHKHESEFGVTPRAGWKGNEFFLISSGGGIKRVYRADSEYLPAFALKKAGAPTPKEIQKIKKEAANLAASVERERKALAKACPGFKAAFARTTCMHCGVTREYHEVVE